MSLSPSIEIHRNPIFIIPINNTLGYIRVLTYIYICYIMIQWSSKSFNQEIPARCLGSGDESCIPKVAREVPLFEDPLCAMGVPWRFDCLGRKAGEKWIPMDSDSFFRLVCGKKHGRSDDDRIAPEQSEVSTSHIYKRPINLQVASSNFRDELIFAVAPVISRCLERRRRSGAFFSRPTSPTTRWWTQTPSYQKERCTERGAGRVGVSWWKLYIMHIHTGLYPD